jgi:FtsP/CotA-like multicopper oxidase with cupredoxin domain
VNLFRPLLAAVALFATVVAHACDSCGGKNKAAWEAFERQPKASQLYPEARIVEYTLEIAEVMLSPAGQPVRALTINGRLPGPVLRFREGDVARIHVRNRLTAEETSTHWHGLLLPNLEDGVPYLSTPPIEPGAVRTFEFLLKHSGTYWYHSHTGLQEQRGVYGAIVVQPKADASTRGDLPPIDRDEVIVLSDWTNESASDVFRTLMRGSDWYAIRKGTAQSLLGAFRAGHVADYLKREKARLPAMDISDVAYDAFLANGRPQQQLHAQAGETIRLRVINAAASTYFYLSSAAGPLTIIAADGMDVVPIRQHRLLIGMAETYDLLITLPADSAAAWEVSATAQDGSGYASIFLGDGPRNPAPATPLMASYSMDDALAAVLDQLDESGERSDAEALANENPRPLSPYPRLKSTSPTTLPSDAPRRDITLKLTGDMTRYLWSIDGRSIEEQSTVPVKRGEILRVALVNNTMMHHPMHLHGHFFRLLVPDAGDPAYAPLKHTVDVPPMSRRVIEFYANEDRDWLFHCHVLYHMKAGMARIMSYPAGDQMPTARQTKVDNDASVTPALPSFNSQRATLNASPPYRPALGEHAMPHTFAWVDANLESHLSSGKGTMQRGRDNLNLAWEAGWGKVGRREYEMDATASRYFNPRWTAFAGYRLTNDPEGHDAVIAGATYRLPYLVDVTTTVQSNGDARIGLGKIIQLTTRVGLTARVDYDTANRFSWSSTLSYTVSKRVSIITTRDSDYGFGGGLGLRF